MKQFSYVPLGKDLMIKFEYSFGILEFDISKSIISGSYEDLKSGWSVSLNYKSAFCNHRVIREDLDVVRETLSGDIDFMNTVMSIIGVLIDDVKPSKVKLLNYGFLDYPENIGGPEVIFTWFTEPEESKRIDRIYYSIL